MVIMEVTGYSDECHHSTGHRVLWFNRTESDRGLKRSEKLSGLPGTLPGRLCPLGTDSAYVANLLGHCPSEVVHAPEPRVSLYLGILLSPQGWYLPVLRR